MALTNIRGHVTRRKAMALLGRSISGLSCSRNSTPDGNVVMEDGFFCFMGQELQSTTGGNVWEREQPTAVAMGAKETAAAVREQEEGPK